MQIVKNLISSKKFIIFYKIDAIKGIEVHVVPDFSGSHDADNILHPGSILSWGENFIMLCACPGFMKISLQIEIVLITTEVEHIFHN